MVRVRRLCHIEIADWNMVLQSDSVTRTIMLFMQTNNNIIEVAGMGPISRAVATKALRPQTRKMHTIHDKKSVLDYGTAVATTSRIISGFGRSSLRRKPNTTSEELRAAVESTRPARNLEIYLWSRVLLDQRPGGTSPLFHVYQVVFTEIRFMW